MIAPMTGSMVLALCVSGQACACSRSRGGPGLLPSRAPSLAGGAGQRSALGLVVQFVEPGLAQSLHGGVLHHRGLLGCGMELGPENAGKPGRRGSGDHPIFRTL
jgi:hypothetical protein